MVKKNRKKLMINNNKTVKNMNNQKKLNMSV